MDEPEDKGYTVKDRRYLHLSEEEKAKVQAEEAQKAAKESADAEAFQEAAQKAESQDQGSQAMPLPEINFSSFLFSLSTSAFIGLGAIPDPQTGKTEKNLPLAKQTIDMLVLLRDKTRNNLTPEEDNLFEHLLYDLRMAYIREVG